MATGSYPKYTDEFKKSIVTLHQNGKSLSQLSREYGISMSALSKWVKMFSEVKIDDDTVVFVFSAKKNISHFTPSRSKARLLCFWLPRSPCKRSCLPCCLPFHLSRGTCYTAPLRYAFPCRSIFRCACFRFSARYLRKTGKALIRARSFLYLQKLGVVIYVAYNFNKSPAFFHIYPMQYIYCKRRFT